MIELKIHKESSYIARTNSLQKKYIRQQKYVVLKHSKYFCNLCNDYPEGKIIAHFRKHQKDMWNESKQYANLFDQV